MPQTKADRSAAAKKAAATRKRNQQRASSSTAGKKAAGTRQGRDAAGALCSAKRAVGSAAVVVTHGGPGSIALSVTLGRRPIVVPRLQSLGEHVDGDIAYVWWKADGIAFGTDTFVVRDGKIASQTVGLHFG